jgi:signal transduction histidine kinase
MNTGNNGEHLVRLRDVTSKVAEQRSVWTFHGQVSHKLRTPLNHLFAALDMIQESDLENTDVDIQTFFSIAKKGANRLKNEIQDIFQYLEASNIATSAAGLSGCSLHEIETLVNEINSLLELASVTVTYENVDNPQTIYGVLSRRATELIMWELLENAKKFHPTQSPAIEVVISLNHHHQVVLKVGDDGLTSLRINWKKCGRPIIRLKNILPARSAAPGWACLLLRH